MPSKIDYEEIDRIIKLFEDKNLTEFELEVEGFKIKIGRTTHAMVPAMQTAAPASAEPPAKGEVPGRKSPVESGPVSVKGQLHFVTSPMVGTFYRASSPSTRPFVEIGEPVTRKQTLCIIEAMKLMNEIESEIDGVVEEIFVENGKPVEFGQKLFSILVSP